MARAKKTPDAMTVAQANLIIQRPVFGDSRCIEARDLLLLAERAKEFHRDPKSDINLLTADELESEIEHAQWAAGEFDA